MPTTTSTDGTTIAYLQLGSGPGLIIQHGAMQTSASQLDLARELSADFTVYLPDRRGRGDSGPVGDDYGVRREVEDLGAVVAATGARFVMGVSSGAIISLTTMLSNPAITRAVVFEPPFDIDGSNGTGWVPRFERELAAGRVYAALVTSMKGTKLGPPGINAIPRPILEFLSKRMGGSFAGLAPTLRTDIRVVEETADTIESYERVEAEVLLMGGDRSADYLKLALDRLEKVLPHVKRVTFPGQGHSVTGNRADRGNPALVAAEVRRFLTTA
ncbi:alpha/beta fold hydrolase [Nonomuraea sp. NPDC050556]|uniref:alpha/beta fold hydrolase n=1 Tax=Nonomuraea sp. NPDC050556 TaxID=3364369 RepID=UPI00379ACDE3